MACATMACATMACATMGRRLALFPIKISMHEQLLPAFSAWITTPVYEVSGTKPGVTAGTKSKSFLKISFLSIPLDLKERSWIWGGKAIPLIHG